MKTPTRESSKESSIKSKAATLSVRKTNVPAGIHNPLIDSGSRMAAQAKLQENLFGQMAQRQPFEEDELLQGKSAAQNGNRYSQRLVESMNVQAKLTVNPPNDIYEQEADRVADEVMKAVKSPAQRQPEEEEELQAKSVNSIQRQPEEEEELQTKPASQMQLQEVPEEEEELQMKLAKSQPATVSENLENRIKAARGSGHPLPDVAQKPMRRAFGADFSGVRVHTDSEANLLSQQLNARAFTAGQDVFFKEGEYSPGSDSGRELIAHELTHTVQQEGDKMGKPMQTEEGTKEKSNGQLISASRETENILQKRELKKDKLNVAGESHPESDKRRGKEKSYAREKGGGKYWTEGEFKYYADAIRIFGKRVRGTGTAKYGDPMVMRLKNFLLMQRDKVLPISKDIVKQQGNAFIFHQGGSKEEVESLRDELYVKYWDEIRLCINKVVESGEMGDDSDKLEKTFNVFLTGSQEMKKIKTDDNGKELGEKAVEVITIGLKEAYDVLSELSPETTEGDVLKERSRFMHIAAVKGGRDSRGLWKIGNEHVGDTKKTEGDIPYNLLTKEEFNEDYEKYAPSA